MPDVLVKKNGRRSGSHIKGGEENPASRAESVSATTARLLFVVTEDWYFCSHRLAHAAAAARSGYQVSVATRVAEHRQQIESSGIEVIPFEMTRRGFNPFAEISTMFRLARLYKQYRPQIVHHVALKPVVYGSIAARIAHVPVIINAISGLGYAFTSSTRSAKVVRSLISRALPRLVNREGSRVVTTDPHDCRALVSIRGRSEMGFIDTWCRRRSG